MNDKRDEVIEAAEKFWVDEGGHPIEEMMSPSMFARMATRFALSRETEIRTQIADELEQIIKDVGSHGQWWVYVQPLIEKLRGNK